MSLLDTSDKVFWHGYIDFYEPFFRNKTINKIAEIGVFKGNSIRWFLERFPQALVCGADILPVQPEWPVDSRFRFTRLDQGDVGALRAFLTQENFDLIVEDGSHIPEHQALALVEGLKALASGGLYILEDVHTSHPAYEAKSTGIFKPFRGNALTVLLAIDHYRKIGAQIDAEKIRLIAANSILSPVDVALLAENIQSISLYRRTRLPDYCYNCGSKDYNFSSLKCRCGVDVFSDSDSMSFVVQKK